LPVPEREQVRAEDGNGPLRFVRYLLKFIAGFLAVSIPQFALVALFLRISPARLIAPFLLILATAVLVGPLVYFAGKNKDRPIVFSHGELLFHRATWHATLLHPFLYVIDSKRALGFGEAQR
jgi:hypothetical protein